MQSKKLNRRLPLLTWSQCSVESMFISSACHLIHSKAAAAAETFTVNGNVNDYLTNVDEEKSRETIKPSSNRLRQVIFLTSWERGNLLMQITGAMKHTSLFLEADVSSVFVTLALEKKQTDTFAKSWSGTGRAKGEMQQTNGKKTGSLFLVWTVAYGRTEISFLFVILTWNCFKSWEHLSQAARIDRNWISGTLVKTAIECHWPGGSYSLESLKNCYIPHLNAFERLVESIVFWSNDRPTFYRFLSQVD